MLTKGNPIDVTFRRLQKELEIVQKSDWRVSHAFQNLELLCELIGEFDIPERKAEIIFVQLEHLKLNTTDFVRSVLNRLSENIREKSQTIKLAPGPHTNKQNNSKHVHSGNVIKLFR